LPRAAPAAIVDLVLYEQIGGVAVLRAAVTVLYQRILADPALAPYFNDVDMERLRAHQHAFLTSALDGPNLFTGRDLAEAHAHLHVTTEAFDRLTDHLTGVLRDLGVDPATVAEVSQRLEELRDLVVDTTTESARSRSGARAQRERAP
jgi:hemoglobin